MTIGNFPKPLRITLLLIALTVVSAAANRILRSNPEPPALTTMGLEAEQDLLMPPMVINSTDDTGPTPTPPPAGGRQFYVSPTRSSGGDGSIGNPWGLRALENYGVVPAGSTVYIRGGTFDLDFTPNSLDLGSADEIFLRMAGNPTAPIIVRPYPGERPIFNIDYLLNFSGNYVYWHEIEVKDSKTNRTADNDYGWPRPGAVVVRGEYIKFINCIFHDINAVTNFVPAVGSEFYGNLFFYFGHVNTGGIPPPGAAKGTGNYIQTDNSGAERKLTNNIFFSNIMNHIQAYGSDAVIMKNLTFEGNTFFDIGKLHAGGAGQSVVVGGGALPTRDIKFNDNYLYSSINDRQQLSFTGGGGVQINLEMKNNRIAGGSEAFTGAQWEPWVFTGNKIFSPYKIGVVWVNPLPTNPSRHTWNNNTYHFLKFPSDPWTRIPFTFNNVQYEFAEWKAATGFDTNSTYTAARPTGMEVYIRPNAYKQGRANITIFNWDLAATANVNLSTSGLTNGQQYAIKDVQNFFGSAVYSGTYNQTSPTITITLPGAGSPVTPWVGANNPGNNGYWVPPVHTSKEFNAFVLLPR